MTPRRFVAALCMFLLCSAAALSLPHMTEGQQINCLDCHGDLAPEKGVHPAVAMGCLSCHTGIDASDVPHKKKNNIAKGLSAEQPDLCYGCHDKSMFEQKVVHAAVGMGCTGCHNPHASKNPKLLATELPDLCYTCHEKGMFTKKVVHAALGMGCTVCHRPHASDSPSLLTAPAGKLCVTCHEKQSSGRHFMSRFSAIDDHPVQGKADPSRPGRELSCVSCHNPHSSVKHKLLVDESASSGNLCLLCHRKVSVRAEGP